MPPKVQQKPSTWKLLTTRLEDIQASFDDICSFIKGCNEQTTLTDVNIRLSRLDELWERYGNTLVEIKSHDDYEGENEEVDFDEERRVYSERYYKSKSFLLDKASALQPPAVLEQSIRVNEAPMQATMDHVRLPQITLQTFNGDIDEWLSFRDLFTSLIHWKTDLSEVEKFHYLKGCLRGEPKNLIDPLEITRNNYQVAWNTLQQRYNNNKQLKKRQVQALFNLPSLTRESVGDLHTLVDGFERAVQTLDQIVEQANYKDLLLISLLTSRLDPITRRSWEEFSSTKEDDSLKDLLEFLQRRIRVLESLPPKAVESKGSHPSQQTLKQKSSIKSSFSTMQSSGGRCVACNENHYLHQCSTFRRMAISDRDVLLKTHSLCRNCFRSGHQAMDCQSRFSCWNCKGRHHTLVCFKTRKERATKVAAVAGGDNPSNSEESDGTTGDNEASDSTSSQVANVAATDITVSSSSQLYTSQVLLATAVVIVEDDEGGRFPARALLDSGSESNFISERMSQRMKVFRERVDISVLGIGKATTKVKHRFQAMVRSRVTPFSQTMNFLVLPKVTVNLPTASFKTNGWSIPSEIQLADPTFFESKAVDLVLGIERFFDFFETGRRISLGERLPTLNESVFGWVVSGGISIPTNNLRINCHTSTTENLEALVTRFWASEEVGSSKVLSAEDQRCEAIFQQTVKRESNGRYSVALPKVDDGLARLGKSWDIAYRRLQGTERRLARDEHLRSQYHQFMEEYLALGHMREVIDTPEGLGKRCYLPHHPVIKEASTTTKVRVVFDASCKTSSGVSLNDILLAGPVIQDDLRAIILRCCIKQIMFVSDVEKMFRQILIHGLDRFLQCILWRASPLDEVRIFEMNTVTYGTKPAPFLATRALKQLTIDEKDTYPLAARAASEDVYMDDVITGTDTVEEACILRTQLDEMMSKGGFQLRKWASNCPKVLEGIPEENLAIREGGGIELDPDSSVKTLGLTWMPITDQFKFHFNIPALSEGFQLTKRQVLSVIAMLFDPLGLLGAVVTTAKIFMQQLWTIRDEHGRTLDWDQPLPSTVGEQWTKYHEQLPMLNFIRIDRCVIIPKAISIEIHCFSDVSSKAFGCCLYMRSQDLEGRIKVRLLSSKSKVAPLKVQSTPRLELCGAVLAVQLFEKVQESIKIPATAYFWTDSSCVWRWIQASPSTWTTFVANRIAKIQSVSDPAQWQHVPGVENPADLISRGIMPNSIAKNNFWWHGPDWLRQPAYKWPNSMDVPFNEDSEKEQRRIVLACTSSPLTEFNEMYLSKFSSYTDLIRGTAYWLRFMRLLRLPSNQRSCKEPLSTAELKEAELTIIRRVQKEVFVEEWKALLKGESVSRKSALKWFNPYISVDQIIRVGGRLQHSTEAEHTKHPIVLPARHTLTRMIVKQYHERLLHAGPQLMLSTIRLKFWPLGGRNIARLTVHRCVKCFRSKPSLVQQFMGELPSPRVTISRPFSKTGVDYFGPMYVRPAPRRPVIKSYVAIFVCLATKAVHLELVTDLSTDRFLQALRRFIARRGRCSDIYSDNGTNFVGARNQLQEFLKLLRNRSHHQRISKECAEEGIQWHFNPPSAPHFGGLWEAAVRSAKNHLLKILGENPASPEDLNTLLTQVEACLNSRPLTALSDDPTDLEALTPAHFLVGSSLQGFPEPDLSDIPTNRLNRWQLMQRNLQEFWKRWRREYLCQLQGRMKRWKPPVLIDVGRLVIIKDDNQPPMRWKMGRILETHPGSDGVVRVVTIKTATGNLKRPVEKICLLPLPDLNDDTDSNNE